MTISTANDVLKLETVEQDPQNKDSARHIECSSSPVRGGGA
jgi:hypothetical protein